MTEKLLQYIWQFQHFNRTNLNTAKGEAIDIVFPGTLNTHQGPDFRDAKIRIGATLLAGSVEIHIKTSDWQKHGHQTDANYKSVILHVVFLNDLPVQNCSLPLLEIGSFIPKILLEKFERLMNTTAFIPCATSIAGVKELTWIAWKERLIAERLTRKSKVVLEFLSQTNFHWEETFWWLLARNFGIKVNSEAFEAVARSVNINILAKHKHQLHQLEALLLGQANELNKNFTEDYPLLLQREYHFLKAKFNLTPIPVPVHYLRMRPGNFPSLRLAQLAMLVHNSAHLFSRILETESLTEIKQELNVTASDYWNTHYRLNEPSVFKKKMVGTFMVDNIIINTVVPMLFAYGSYHNNERYQSKALQWLEETAAEDNTILTSFTELHLANHSAYDSQALLELKNEYCNHKRCLECAVGNSLLKHTGA